MDPRLDFDEPPSPTEAARRAPGAPRPPSAGRPQRRARPGDPGYVSRARLAFVVVLVAGSVAWWSTARPVPVGRAVGAVPIEGEPSQEELPKGSVPPFERTTASGRYTLEPRARYRIAGRVVGTKRYYSGWEVDLARIDVGLAWGVATRPDVTARVRYLQANRWIFYSARDDLPISLGQLMVHVSNNHLIPATRNLERTVAWLHAGDAVEVEGYLVDVVGDLGGARVGWGTSLVRDDSGDGSCEVFYVERLRIGARTYE